MDSSNKGLAYVDLLLCLQAHLLREQRLFVLCDYIWFYDQKLKQRTAASLTSWTILSVQSMSFTRKQLFVCLSVYLQVQCFRKHQGIYFTSIYHESVQGSAWQICPVFNNWSQFKLRLKVWKWSQEFMNLVRTGNKMRFKVILRM